jgi:hypothetical protein
MTSSSKPLSSMNIDFQGLTKDEEELFMEAWDFAKCKLELLLPIQTNTDAYKKWFKSEKNVTLINDNFKKIKKFFTQNGNLIIKKNSNLDEENCHGSAHVQDDGKYCIELPKIFFDEKKFKRQSDVLIHEISHLAADTRDIEPRQRAGNAADEIKTNFTGQLMTPQVARRDSYSRYHVAKLSPDEASTCAASYEFFSKDQYAQSPPEEKKRHEETYYGAIKAPDFSDTDDDSITSTDQSSTLSNSFSSSSSNMGTSSSSSSSSTSSKGIFSQAHPQSNSSTDTISSTSSSNTTSLSSRPQSNIAKNS